MEISIHCVGKIKEPYLKSGIEEYLKRLKPYCNIVIHEVNDESVNNSSRGSDIKKVIDIEGKRILSTVKDKRMLICLDLNKNQLESPSFADFLQKSLENSDSRIGFVIGGSYGISDEVRARCSYFLSLSKMTFLHTMTRLILLEQIYRGFKINHNEVYHK